MTANRAACAHPTTSVFNAAGRQSYRIDARATFAYDSAGNRTTTENASVTVTATYDGLNRRDFVTTECKV